MYGHQQIQPEHIKSFQECQKNIYKNKNMECEGFQNFCNVIYILKFGQVQMKYIADFFAVFIFVTKLNTKTSEENMKFEQCLIALYLSLPVLNINKSEGKLPSILGCLPIVVISHETEKKQVKCFNLDSNGILMCWQLFGSWTDW